MSSTDEDNFARCVEIAEQLVDNQASLCFNKSDWERAVNSAVDEVLENENLSTFENNLFESIREYARVKHGSTY